MSNDSLSIEVIDQSHGAVCGTLLKLKSTLTQSET